MFNILLTTKASALSMDLSLKSLSKQAVQIWIVPQILYKSLNKILNVIPVSFNRKEVDSLILMKSLYHSHSYTQKKGLRINNRIHYIRQFSTKLNNLCILDEVIHTIYYPNKTFLSLICNFSYIILTAYHKDVYISLLYVAKISKNGNNKKNSQQNERKTPKKC